MKKILLYLLILSSLANYSCNKKCDTIDELPHEYLRYWYFDVGSWWVYQLKDTVDVYDTVTVVDKDVHNTPPNDEDGHSCTEYIVIGVKHSNILFLNYLQYELFESYRSNTCGNKECYYVDFGLFKIYSDVSLFYSDVSLFYYIENTGLTCDYGACYDIQLVQTPQYTFNETLHYYPFDSLHFYYVKNVGIVKRITNDGKIWELINYNVSQNF